MGKKYGIFLTQLLSFEIISMSFLLLLKRGNVDFCTNFFNHIMIKDVEKYGNLFKLRALIS